MSRRNKIIKMIAGLSFFAGAGIFSVTGMAAQMPTSEMAVQAIETESQVQTEAQIVAETETQTEAETQRTEETQLQTETQGTIKYQESSQKVTRASGIAVNESNFPDPVFREYVLEYIAGEDGILSEQERNEVQYLELYYEEELGSVKGIEYFPNLEYLYLDGSKALKSLDLRKMKALKEAHCEDSGLTSLKVNGLTELKKLYCSQNELKTLNLTGLTALEQLECSANALTSLSVKKLTSLKYLICRENQIRSLDLSGMGRLERADCEGNSMTSLKLGSVPELRILLCGTNQLTDLELGGAPKLATLYCYQNRLTTLNCTANAALAELEAFENQIRTLELSGLKHLVSINCSANRIGVLDVASASGLTSLIADNNAIPALNLSGNKKLQQASFQNQVVTVPIVQTANGYQVDFSANTFKKKSVTDLKDAKTNKTGLFWKIKSDIPESKTVSYTYRTGKAGITIPVTVHLSGIKKWNPRPKKVNFYYAANIKGKKLSMKWKKQSGVSGYQICYGTSSRFASGKTKKLTLKKASARSKVLKGLKIKKTYYVRIRAYRKYKGKTYYGAYSSKRKIRISK